MLAMTGSDCLRRGLAALLLAALVAAAPACGGDDDSESGDTTTTEPAAPATCRERFVELASRPDVVEAAHSGADLPDDAETAFDELDTDCGDEFDALSDADFEAIVDQLDPVVVEYLGSSQSQEFEETGSAISGL
jgi:hypothetical protein